jgi:hypothetical protein
MRWLPEMVMPRGSLSLALLFGLMFGATAAICEEGKQSGFDVVGNRTVLTAYPNFDNACLAAAARTSAPGSNDRSTGRPVLVPIQGLCPDGKTPLLISVTHENAQNNHQGAANQVEGSVSYMSDFVYGVDFGKWLNVKMRRDNGTPILMMALDTANFNKTNVTGWPLRYGHLFLGLNDGTVKATLDKDVYVEFDLRLRRSDVRPELYRDRYSGRRIMLGSVTDWDEAPPRTNRSHFLEVDLIQSDGYTESYREPVREGCRDTTYDRCFYDRSGKFAEGREVRYQTHLGGAPIIANDAAWTHVAIPLSRLIRKLRWVSPPGDWAAVHLRGIYLGVESEGATKTVFEVTRYQVYAL